MPDRIEQLSLKRYTFHSLEFSSTPVTAWQGEQLKSVVNEMYLPFIRDGLAIPLSFIIDISTLLLNSTAAPRGFDAGPSVELRRLSARYRLMLLKLRRDPIVERLVNLLREIGDVKLQGKVIATFLRFLVSGASGFKNIYSFDSRRFVLAAAKITDRGVGFVFTDGSRQPQRDKILFLGKSNLGSLPETRAVQDVLQMLCRHFEETPLADIVSPDLQLVIEIAARTPAGTSRVDYRFLSWLLNRSIIEDVTQEEPHPRLVDEFLPTNVHDFEGQTGGYIDVARRKFQGNVAEVLPAEMALWKHPELALQKLLNEGIVCYVRENFEFIERELRVMFCFVVDNSSGMMRSTRDASHELGRGLTPYIRARALALTMIQDLARWMPRIDVHVDCGLFLWSQPQVDSRIPEPTCTGEVDLFSLSPADAADRPTFLRGLTKQFPEVFYNRVNADDAEARPELETDPWQFAEYRNRSRRYHCRHFILLSSSQTLGRLVDNPPRIPLEAYDSGPDSVHLVTCDVTQASLGIARVDSLEHAWDLSSGSLPASISEAQLRHQFMTTVMLKGAGRPLLEGAGNVWDELS